MEGAGGDGLHPPACTGAGGAAPSPPPPRCGLGMNEIAPDSDARSEKPTVQNGHGGAQAAGGVRAGGCGAAARAPQA